MGRHIVRTFRRMPEQRIACRDQSSEEALHVSLYLRVGVFLDQDRCRRMADVETEKSLIDPDGADPANDLAGQLVEPGTTGLKTKFF